MKQLCDYQAKFAEIDLSPLLGISQPEYEHLVHGPLYNYKNEQGDIVEFFMHVSPYNHGNILNKIKRNQHNMVVFQPSEIFELNRQQFLVSNTEDTGFTSKAGNAMQVSL